MVRGTPTRHLQFPISNGERQHHAAKSAETAPLGDTTRGQQAGELKRDDASDEIAFVPVHPALGGGIMQFPQVKLTFYVYTDHLTSKYLFQLTYHPMESY